MRARLAVASLAVLLPGLLGVYRLWPRALLYPTGGALTPVVRLGPEGASVLVPDRALVAEVATFDDEFFAYLMFGYLRGLVSRDGVRAWLTYDRQENALVYRIRLGPQEDLLCAAAYLSRLRAEGLISDLEIRWVTPEVRARYEAQSKIFDTAYTLPPTQRLEELSRAQLVDYIKRFIRFKAETDARVRQRLTPEAQPPGPDEARRLAEDIVTVADFFQLPLDFFLGIGAMENNYMHVKGDLGHAVWKRRAEKGDIILRRGPRGVLVLNESSGVWQITRETLRHAHRLYRKDQRDYSLLPEHLRPQRELNLEELPPEVLTTYAGLFFRELLDRFEGDVSRAVAAYNGGPGNPNFQYEAGVRAAAEHARRVLEHAAALRERPAAGMLFLTASR